MSFAGLSGHTMSEFRKALRSADADVFATKNKTAAIALKELNYDSLTEKISGQSAFVWGEKDSVDVAKVLIDLSQ